MAIGAACSIAAGWVEVVLRSVIRRGFVALGADAVVRRPQLIAVRFVTVAAYDAGLVHLALDERSVDVDFVQDLAVIVVQG